LVGRISHNDIYDCLVFHPS